MRYYLPVLIIVIVLAAILVAVNPLQEPPFKDSENETISENQDVSEEEARIIPDVPRDAIPPLFFPEYISLSETDLQDEDFVLGFELGEDTRAYPLKILNFHEIVNDEIGGEKVLITYCPLCRSGIVFSRILNGRELTFGNTGALFESALVMYDKETESYWGQVGGEAIKGELKGTKLEVLPSNILTFGEWKSLHTNTKVLTKNLGFNRNYDLDPYEGSDRPELPAGWPISNEDSRLLPREKVLGIQVGQEFKAYSLTQLKNAVINDEIGGKKLVIFSTDTESGFVYERELEGEALEFELIENKILDKSTNSEWDISGKSISGELKEKKLTPYPSVAAFWFSWSTIHPETEIYTRGA